MPILDNEGEVVGVAQIVNKVSRDQTSFSTADEEVAIISKNLSNKYLVIFTKKWQALGEWRAII